MPANQPSFVAEGNSDTAGSRSGSGGGGGFGGGGFRDGAQLGSGGSGFGGVPQGSLGITPGLGQVQGQAVQMRSNRGVQEFWRRLSAGFDQS